MSNKEIIAAFRVHMRDCYTGDPTQHSGYAKFAAGYAAGRGAVPVSGAVDWRDGLDQVIAELREQAHEYRQADESAGMFADPGTADLFEEFATRIAALQPAQTAPTEAWECAQMDAFNTWMRTASPNINQFSAMAGWMACARAKPQPTQTARTDSSLLLELRDQIHEMQGAAYCYGHSEETARVALDGVKDAIDDLLASQPTAAVSDDFDELLGQYWSIAYSEGESSISRGDEANEVLHKLRALLSHQAAPAQLPQGMPRDEMMQYYSDYANLCAREALRYQKRIHELEAALSAPAAQQPSETATWNAAIEAAVHASMTATARCTADYSTDNFAAFNSGRYAAADAVRSLLRPAAQEADRLPGAVDLLVRAGHTREEARSLINDTAAQEAEKPQECQLCAGRKTGPHAEGGARLAEQRLQAARDQPAKGGKS